VGELRRSGNDKGAGNESGANVCVFQAFYFSWTASAEGRSSERRALF
jgi:hypothetical protein